MPAMPRRTNRLCRLLPLALAAAIGCAAAGDGGDPRVVALELTTRPAGTTTLPAGATETTTMPAVQAKTWDVNTVEELEQAVRNCSPGDHIVLAPGQYRLRRWLYVTKARVVIRGRTGIPDDVELCGGGMNNDADPENCIWMAADGIQLRDLTIRDFYKYGVVLSGREPSRTLPDDLVLSNLHFIDCGTRHIKGVNSRDYSERVLIEKVYCLQRRKYLRRPGHPVDSNNYIGGIDCMRTKDWIIRDCRFEGIKGATGGGRGAIFMWIGSVNPLIERNVIIDCAAGICLGNGHNPNREHQVSGGIVRNNFIYHAGGWRSVEMGFLRGLKFVHNTIYEVSPDATAIDIYDARDLPAQGLELRNNIVRGRIVSRARGEMIDADNVTGEQVLPEWFADPAAGRLFLTAKADGAIGKVPPLKEVPEDITGRARPVGRNGDAGAHQRR